MSENHLNIVQNYLSHLKNKELELAMSYVADDTIWHSDNINAPWSGTHHGKKALLKHLENIKKYTKSFKKEVYDLVAGENSNYVYEYGHLSCEFHHTQEIFNTYIISIYEIIEGKIHSYRVLEDNKSLYQIYHQCDLATRSLSHSE